MEVWGVHKGGLGRTLGSVGWAQRRRWAGSKWPARPAPGWCRTCPSITITSYRHYYGMACVVMGAARFRRLRRAGEYTYIFMAARTQSSGTEALGNRRLWKSRPPRALIGRRYADESNSLTAPWHFIGRKCRGDETISTTDNDK